MLWALVVAAVAGEPQPTEQTIIYYNARMALREGDALEAVKLWLLRNAVGDLTGTVSAGDADFRSVTWAALGEMGICQDGHRTDEDGAGLWPLALHNFVVRNMGRKPPKPRRPFAAFDVGRQQRFVSIGDVLSAPELGEVSLFRGRCLRPTLALVSAGEPVTADLSDRQTAAVLLQFLLNQAQVTLADDRVRGRAAIEARLFDVHLQLTAMAAREARQEAREQARLGRQVGLSRESVASMDEEAAAYSFADHSQPARILRGCVEWPVSEWMALSAERRLFLFDHAAAYGGDPQALDNIALGVIDALIERGDGEQVEAWIAHRGAGEAVDQRPIWAGDRGRRLLALDREAGFQERAVIALHRGVHDLEQGDLPGALRSMAYALQHAPDSRVGDTVQGLSRRWMSYAASQFEITDDLLVTLQTLVPRRDYGIVLEDLMWRAAFHADRASFDRGVDNQLGRDALERRLALLAPLASGDVGQFSALVRGGLSRSPSETLRFLDQLVQRLELEDADVRAAHVQTLASVRRLLAPMATDGGRGRTVGALLERSQALLEGVGGLGSDASATDRARSSAPTGEVFAGSVRLAPADPLPWPFSASQVAAPSIFEPVRLTPEEWRGASGEWVFGWSIGG
jgi:hypothetical protein